MSLPKEFTVQELLYFTGKAFDLSSTQATIKSHDVLSKIQLTEYASTEIGHLSSGLLRRLEIGQALMNSAEILFLDEPTIFLDPLSVNQILDLVANLNDEGITVFYTTHLLREVEQLCTHLAVINHGSILLCDKVDLLKKQSGRSVNITVRSGDLTKAEFLLKKQGWKMLLKQNVISVLIPSHAEVEATLAAITDILNKNSLRYSEIGVEQASLNHIYTKIITEGSSK